MNEGFSFDGNKISDYTDELEALTSQMMAAAPREPAAETHWADLLVQHFAAPALLKGQSAIDVADKIKEFLAHMRE